MAAKNLSRYGIDKDLLNDLDKAKYLLVVLDVQNKTGQHLDDNDLKTLLEIHKESNEDWERIQKRYFTIMQEKN